MGRWECGHGFPENLKHFQYACTHKVEAAWTRCRAIVYRGKAQHGQRQDLCHVDSSRGTENAVGTRPLPCGLHDLVETCTESAVGTRPLPCGLRDLVEVQRTLYSDGTSAMWTQWRSCIGTECYRDRTGPLPCGLGSKSCIGTENAVETGSLPCRLREMKAV